MFYKPDSFEASELLVKWNGDWRCHFLRSDKCLLEFWIRMDSIFKFNQRNIILINFFDEWMRKRVSCHNFYLPAIIKWKKNCPLEKFDGSFYPFVEWTDLLSQNFHLNSRLQKAKQTIIKFDGISFTIKRIAIICLMWSDSALFYRITWKEKWS